MTERKEICDVCNLARTVREVDVPAVHRPSPIGLAAVLSLPATDIKLEVQVVGGPVVMMGDGDSFTAVQTFNDPHGKEIRRVTHTLRMKTREE